MEQTEEFVRWSASHWGAVIATAIVTLCIIGGAMKKPLEVRQKVCRALAVVVGLIYLGDSSFIVLTQYHGTWEQNLPLHYCSMMLLVAIFALWTRNRTACWVLYFGALTACLQGLITPALDAAYPSLRFIFFFSLHGILMPAALAVPLLLGTNYGFTMKSPVPGCILDYAGPAPWYYLLLQIPAFALFSLLRLPVRAKKD